MKVADLLSEKGHTVKTVRREDTIGALSQRLAEERVGAMIVSDDGKSLDGIISERDIAFGLHNRRGDLHLVKVSVLMTKDVVTCTPETTIQDAALLMAKRYVRHLAVVDSEKIVGVISMRDVLGRRLDELQRRTDVLKKFVALS